MCVCVRQRKKEIVGVSALVNLNALVYVYVASQWTWQMCRPLQCVLQREAAFHRPSQASTLTHKHTHTLCHLFALALLLVPHSPTPHLHNKPPHPHPHTPLLSFLPERPCPNQTQQINNSTCRSCHGINYAQRVSLIRGLLAGCPWHVSGCPCVSAAQR